MKLKEVLPGLIEIKPCNATKRTREATSREVAKVVNSTRTRGISLTLMTQLKMLKMQRKGMMIAKWLTIAIYLGETSVTHKQIQNVSYEIY